MKHFFDIGANVGQTFDYLATLDRDFRDHKFWAFEPSPRHLSALLEKCESVKDRYDVTVCPFGIGGETRLRKFYEKDDVLGDSFCEWHASDHAPINRAAGYAVLAPVVSITQAISILTHRGDEIVLDIDAEGCEYEMLSDLMRRGTGRVREVWVEWHRIDPSGSDKMLTPEVFGEWCKSAHISIVHRGLQNLTATA